MTLLLTGSVGFMEVFFAKMGVKNLRFKPAYNPYTEVRQPRPRHNRYRH